MYRLIIVEDEIVVRIGLEHAVEWSKYNIEVVASVSNGKQALEAYHDIGADIIITDIKMAIMDGVSLIQEIRKEDTAVKVVVLTCMADFNMIQDLVPYGISYYFTKHDLDMIKFEQVIASIVNEVEKAIHVNQSNQSQKRMNDNSSIEEYLHSKSLTKIPDALEELRIKNGSYAFAIIKILNEEVDETIQAPLISIVNQLLKKREFGVCFGKNNKNIIIFYAKQLVNDKEFIKLILESLKYIKDMLFTYFNWMTETYVNDVFTNFDLIQEYFYKLEKEPLNDANVSNEMMLATEYIQKHLHENISLIDVATHVNYSVSYLSYIFKRQINMTFSDFILQLRMKKAKSLLSQTSDKLYIIAEKCGYQSAGYFTKVFTRTMNMTPNKYRNTFNRGEKD